MRLAYDNCRRDVKQETHNCRGAIKTGQVCAIKTGLSVRSKVG